LPGCKVIQNLLTQVQIPPDGTPSRTINQDETVKVLVFGFVGGQELSQHTASVPALVQILQGDARVNLDGEEQELSAGSWIYLEANLPHAIYARTDMIMLLTMLTGAQPTK